MRVSLSLALLLSVLSPLLRVEGGLVAQIGLQEVTRIRFEGNESYSDEVLSTAILTRETECRSIVLAPFCWAGSDFALDPYFFGEREFRIDHARVWGFYFQRGFREVEVDTLVDRSLEGEVHITFQIQEGEPIVVDSLAFGGEVDVLLSQLGDSSVVENLPIRLGAPLNLLALDATRDTLETRLNNLGYAYAEVTRNYFIPRDMPYRAEVFIDVFPGPSTRFGAIQVIWEAAGTEAPTGPQGNGEPAVSEAVIRRMLPFQEGDPYSQELLFAGQRNLYNLELFRFVGVQPDSGAIQRREPAIPHALRVVPGTVHRVRAGGGFSTAECLNAEARWASRNFVGGARRLQLTGRVSNVLASFLEPTPLCPEAGTGEFGDLNWLVSADFSQPWLWSPRNSLSASVFWERQSLKDVFIEESYGLTLAITRTLNPSTPLTFSFRPQLSELSAAEVFLCSSYLICSPGDVQILQDPNWLSPIGVTLAQDRRNQPLSPTRGHSALVDVEYAGSWTGSDFPYTRVISEATWHTQRGSRQGRPRWVFGARLRGGWVSPGGFEGLGASTASTEIVHPEKRLYSGGANSVRGFSQNRLGPQVLQLRDVQDVLGTSVDDQGTPVCTPESVHDYSCDASPLGDEAFLPRPTGGTVLLEGSVEVRFPVDGSLWEGAAFLDFGEVWAERDQVTPGDLEWTPGLGIRYFSPIGPIRVDLAYSFAGGERLQVVTADVEPYDPLVHGGDGELRGPEGQGLGYAESDNLVPLDPTVLWGDLNPWSFRRFQLHFSIGQAF